MNFLLNIIKKELKELLTPATMVTIIVVMIMFIALGSFVGGAVNDTMSQKAVIYSDYSTDPDDYTVEAMNDIRAEYTAKGLDPDDYFVRFSPSDCEYMSDEFKSKLYSFMNEKGIDTAVIIDKDFNSNAKELKAGQYYVFWNQKNISAFSSMDQIAALTFINTMDKAVRNCVLSDKGASDDVIRYINAQSTYQGSTYLEGTLHEGVTPTDIYSALSKQSMFIPIVIMIIIVMIGSILISSMGNEKENKTLETLLTLPVKRTTIVAGKLIGAAIAGFVMGAFYMVGMYFYINSMTRSITGNVSMADLGLTLSAVDWVLIVIQVFLSILCALGMCMILGAFAKNYKAAQMYVLPIAVLALIPMFITMFSSYADLSAAGQAIMFIIPFSHPMMVMQNLIFGNTALVLGGIAYMAAFAAVMIAITVRLYKSDILLTGISFKRHKAKE